MKRFLRCWNRLGVLYPPVKGGEFNKSFVIFKRCRENECSADTASFKPFGIRVVLDPETVRADSHIACLAHASPMQFPCHAVPLRV